MDKIVIVTSVCEESAQELAFALHSAGLKVVWATRRNYEANVYGKHTLLSYGSAVASQRSVSSRINEVGATLACIDKVSTFMRLRGVVPIPEFCTNRRDVPKYWDHVVVRNDACGRMAKDFTIIDQHAVERVPIGADLYTKYIYHRYEYRVVVFKDKAFVYYKKPDGDGNVVLTYQKSEKYEAMIKDARKAAKALKIDYVGFDVVANNRSSYTFLEANSGPILCEEVKQEIVRYFKEQK